MCKFGIPPDFCDVSETNCEIPNVVCDFLKRFCGVPKMIWGFTFYFWGFTKTISDAKYLFKDNHKRLPKVLTNKLNAYFVSLLRGNVKKNILRYVELWVILLCRCRFRILAKPQKIISCHKKYPHGVYILIRSENS